MCWSWQVSLSFVVFQIIALGYVTIRNKYIDRWYVLVCLPFLGQEICQFILWAFGEIESVDPDEPFECNETNLITSKLLIIDAFLIPLFISLFAYKTSINTNKCILFMWQYWFYFQLITYLIIVPFMLLDKECVAVGPNGHQKWPPLFTPQIFTEYLGDWPTTIIISVYYFPSICLVAIFYKPLWVSWMPAIYGISSIIVLSITIGSEAYSVWCWSCACITLWVLMYVPIAQWMVKSYYKKRHFQVDNDDLTLDNFFGDNCFIRLFFTNTHQHFEKFFMKGRAAELEMEQHNNAYDISDDENQAFKSDA